MYNQSPSQPLVGPSLPPDQSQAAQPRPAPTAPPNPQATRQELAQAIRGSNQILATANTTMALFPDTVTVDRTKVTISRRTFLRTAEVTSLRIEDILNVTAKVGFFFGSILVVSRVFNAEVPHEVGMFWRDDASRLKRIIQGYVIAMQQQIDCNALPTSELAKLLDELGQDDHPEAP